MNGFRFVTHDVTVKAANDVVNFSKKMDSRSVICTGVMATVVTNAALKSSSTVCEASVTFAEDKTPVHIPVTNKPMGEQKKFHLQQFVQTLNENVNIDGYVNDFGTSAIYPYTVQIAFRVVDNIKK
jgi:hypothetical protein